MFGNERWTTLRLEVTSSEGGGRSEETGRVVLKYRERDLQLANLSKAPVAQGQDGHGREAAAWSTSRASGGGRPC